MPFLILTSSTFDTTRYARFFGVDIKNVIEVKGKNYPIKENYPPVVVSDCIKYAVETSINIHVNNKDTGKYTDIIIFSPGKSRIS